MKFSKKTEYGLRALIDMSLQQERGGRLTTHDIAERQHIPERFLEQQITALRNAGLVNSQRGALGGCCLARRADAISVLDVVEALEGAILEQSVDEAEGRAGSANRAIGELLGRAQEALSTMFGSVSIADLARRELDLYEASCQMFYV